MYFTSNSDLKHSVVTQHLFYLVESKWIDSILRLHHIGNGMVLHIVMCRFREEED
jgi:hypothetical protein